MITLLQNGAWLLNGQEIVEDTADSATILNSKLGYVPEKKDAAAQTMAYNILQAHKTSDSNPSLHCNLPFRIPAHRIYIILHFHICKFLKNYHKRYNHLYIYQPLYIYY